MTSLEKCKGLGPESVKQLNAIGIFTKEDLEEIGAIEAFIKLNEHSQAKPSLNFLYALVGALNDRNWIEVAREEKAALLYELKSNYTLKALFDNQDTHFNSSTSKSYYR